MAKQKQVNWIHLSRLSIETSKCVVYSRDSMTPRAWNALKSSIYATAAVANFSSTNQATAIVCISNSLILVI
jgi:hypothetical protein